MNYVRDIFRISSGAEIRIAPEKDSSLLLGNCLEGISICIFEIPFGYNIYLDFRKDGDSTALSSLGRCIFGMDEFFDGMFTIADH